MSEVQNTITPAVAVAPVAQPAESAAPQPELTPAEKRLKVIEDLKAKIARDTQKLAELVAAHEVADKLAAVDAGTAIRATVGRADTKREVVATVIGKKVDDSGIARYKIYAGEGYDAETHVIFANQILEVLNVA